MAQSVSILNKIADITVEDKQFTNSETGEIIEYKRIVLHLAFDGDEDVIELVPAKAEGKSAYKLIKAADNVEA